MDWVHEPQMKETEADVLHNPAHYPMMVVVVVYLPRPMEDMGRLQFSDDIAVKS